MKVLTFLNEKGGVGKTTLSSTVAAGLAIKGKRVLVIDTDAQANCTSGFGLPERGDLYQLIVKDGDWRDLLMQPPLDVWAGMYQREAEGSLLVLSSNIETRAIPMLVDDVRVLSERLEELAASVDVVIIDTSPTPSMLHSMVYLASDYMIYPSQCEILSMVGLGKSIAHMKRMTSTRQSFDLPPTKLLGIQPMMYDGGTVAHRHGLEKITEQFGDKTWEPLSVRTAWREASFAQQSIFAYAPNSCAAVDAWKLVARVMQGLWS